MGDLYFNSALINLFIWFWLASSAAAMRLVLERRHGSAGWIFACALGPLAWALLWILGSKGAIRHDHAKKSRKDNSVIAILATAAFGGILVFGLIKLGPEQLLASNETLFLRLTLMIVILGIILGLALSHLTKRVAFFESVWATLIFSISLLALKSHAEDIFSYGTSATYFSTLILSLSTLLLLFLVLGGAFGYLLFGEGSFNPRFFYERFIGIRFLMTKRSSQVVSLITLISVVAVMIACGGMIVVMSVMNGFSSDLRAKILGANAHLMVLKFGKDFTEYADVMEKSKDIRGIVGMRPFVLKEGMVSSKRNLAGSIVTGVDVDGDKNPDQLLKYVSKEGLENLKHPQKIVVVEEASQPSGIGSLSAPKEIKNELPGVILGKEMANDLQVFVGDAVNIISPVGEIGPSGPIPKAKPFRVAGLFESGMYEYDAKFSYIRLEDAQEFFSLGSAVSGVEFRVDDIEQTRRIAQEIDDAIGGYPFYTRDWMQMNRPMFSALQLEKVAMLIILGTLIFMASLLILVTLIMVVMEKGKEIAILKSMGATDVSIMKIFVTYGLCIGASGATLGGSLGLGVCLLIEKVGIRLDADVYYFSNLPVLIDGVEISLVVIAAILISFLATIPPALFAARVKPVEGLRYE